jgi:hypothetical protein
LHIVRWGVMPCDCFGEVVLDTGREGLVWALGWNVVNVYVVVGIGLMIGVRCRLLWKGWCWRCRRTSMIFCSPRFRTSLVLCVLLLPPPSPLRLSSLTSICLATLLDGSKDNARCNAWHASLARGLWRCERWEWVIARGK